MSWCSEPDPEKVGPFMLARYPIPGVVDRDVASMTSIEWLVIFTLPKHSSPDRLTDLEGCTITRVEHYRQRRSPIAREVIVLHMRSREDIRFIRLERFRLPQPRDPPISEDEKGKHDSVKIVNTIRKAIGNDYDLVQAFSVQEKKLDIIDAAQLAFALTHLAKDYSLLHHMCMWWAATFFAAARGMANDPVLTKGPAFKNRGKIYTFRLIDDECRLIQPSGQTIDSITASIRSSMQDSKMDPALIENLITSLRSDYAHMSDIGENDFDIRQSPILDVTTVADCGSASGRLILKGRVEDSVRKRDRAKEIEELEARIAIAKEGTEELQAQAAMAKDAKEELLAQVMMAKEAKRQAKRQSAALKNRPLLDLLTFLIVLYIIID